jgi:hypothetical protein
MAAVDHIEAPQYVLCGPPDVIATAVVWKVITERGMDQFALEPVNISEK